MLKQHFSPSHGHAHAARAMRNGGHTQGVPPYPQAYNRAGVGGLGWPQDVDMLRTNALENAGLSDLKKYARQFITLGQ